MVQRRARRNRPGTTAQAKVKVIAPKREETYVLRWRDPVNRQERQRATDIPKTRANRRLAEREAANLEAHLATADAHCEGILWESFVKRYEGEHLSGLALKTQSAWRTARNHLVRVVRPIFLTDITEAAIGKLTLELRNTETSETSIACYLRTILAAMNWAVDPGRMLSSAPTIRPPKRSKGKTKTMRARPITLEDYERMLLFTDRVRPRDATRWQRLLTGLWLSGLRIAEAIKLSWDHEDGFCIMDSHPYPLYRIFAEDEKGHQDRYLPVSPEFVAWLREIPASQRKGRVFGFRMSAERAGRVIGQIGKAANAIVNSKGKTASAHDFRRAFGTRWASKLSPAELKELMRHDSIDTTMKFYIHLDAMKLSESLWSKSGGAVGGSDSNSSLLSAISSSPNSLRHNDLH